MSTNRLEAFSDGVIAVAITLLVLELAVPSVQMLHQQHESLARALGRNWADYAAYVVSFLTIGIIWINHHVMIGRLQQVDHLILVQNLLLLMTIGALPFATHLIAIYINQPGGAKLAAAVYGGAFLAMALAFATLNWIIMFPKAHFLSDEMPPERRAKILRRSISGVVPYMIATGLAAVSPYVTLAICAALAAFYALPIASGVGV